tara:strand:- start:488 stop:601 length:114 start_codon:yes stop_codon:yes gene_type:complete
MAVAATVQSEKLGAGRFAMGQFTNDTVCCVMLAADRD